MWRKKNSSWKLTVLLCLFNKQWSAMSFQLEVFFLSHRLIPLQRSYASVWCLLAILLAAVTLFSNYFLLIFPIFPDRWGSFEFLTNLISEVIIFLSRLSSFLLLSIWSQVINHYTFCYARSCIHTSLPSLVDGESFLKCTKTIIFR